MKTYAAKQDWFLAAAKHMCGMYMSIQSVRIRLIFRAPAALLGLFKCANVTMTRRLRCSITAWKPSYFSKRSEIQTYAAWIQAIYLRCGCNTICDRGASAAVFDRHTSHS